MSEYMKSILVTGASSGIGRATVERLARDRCLVYATVRTKRDYDSLKRIPSVRPLMMDVTREAQVRRAVTTIRRAGKGLDGLVNNAAVIDIWPVVELTGEDLRRSFETNVFGAHRLVREAIPLLAKSHGRVVNVSSIEGLVTTKFAAAYEMTKFALEAFSDNLRRELIDYGVMVSVVEPGGFRTNYAETTAKLLKKRARSRRPLIMQKEVAEISDGWQEEIADVARRASPTLVAAAVREALLSARPKNRYVVTAREAEFRWVMEEMMSKLVEVNRGAEHGLSAKDFHTLLDSELSKRA